jgi:hypothetical protein
MENVGKLSWRKEDGGKKIISNRNTAKNGRKMQQERLNGDIFCSIMREERQEDGSERNQYKSFYLIHVNCVSFVNHTSLPPLSNSKTI